MALDYPGDVYVAAANFRNEPVGVSRPHYDDSPTAGAGPGPLVEALDESDHQLDRVEKLLQLLRERLAVVTRGPDPAAPAAPAMDAVKAQPRSPASPMTCRARDTADRIRRVGDRVDSLLNRLEV